MSTVAPENSPSGSFPSLENLLLHCPEEGTVILRSQDCYKFRVPKLYIINSSPILRDEILISPNPQSGVSAISTRPGVEWSTDTANVHQVVHLSVNSTILISLLSYIFPIPPILPSTTEQIMELLSVAQMYKMDVILTHIRNHIAQQQPPLIRKENAFSVYALAQKYGLRKETLQAARCILGFSYLTIKALAEEDLLGLMPCAFLHELWKYDQRFQSILRSDVEEFKSSSRFEELAIVKDSSCISLTDSGIPYWLDSYLFVQGYINISRFLDFNNFHSEYEDHYKGRYARMFEECSYCSELSEDLYEFWDALTAVVQGSMAKVTFLHIAGSGDGPDRGAQAESDIVLGVEGTRPENDFQARETRVPPNYSDMPNADIVLQSSDLVNFGVHRSVLITSSPFFRDMFSLPQPLNGVASDGPPVVPVSEDAEVLNSLISMLYPVPPELPHSSDSILALLAATDKYDMGAVQSFIRAEVNRKELLSPTDSGGVFKMYAIAYNKRLVPEMETAARLSLDYPLTFESIGEALRLFDDRALHGLVDFRQRCLHDLSSRLKSFVSGPKKIWIGCRTIDGRPCLPQWLFDVSHSWQSQCESGLGFYNAVPKYVQVYDNFLRALQKHVDESDCHFCLKVYTLKGEDYCKEMEQVLEQPRNVPPPSFGGVPGD